MKNDFNKFSFLQNIAGKKFKLIIYSFFLYLIKTHRKLQLLHFQNEQQQDSAERMQVSLTYFS